MENQPFNLSECVEDSLDLLAANAAQKGLELVSHLEDDVPENVVGDVTRARQILVNLVGNAVKFTHKGEVVVRVMHHQHGELEQATGAVADVAQRAALGLPVRLHFTVRDTGIGIAEDKLEQLFKSFSQVDTSTTRHYGGTGLGLAISKNLAELMGGKMWVTSSAGEGSTFHFTIEVQPAPQRPPEAPAALQGLTVLLVDNHTALRHALARQCARWGLRVKEAATGTEALEWLRAGGRFELGVLDRHMPEMDGLTLAKEIRRWPGFERTPLVLLASLADRKEDFETAAIKFAACLSKPVKHGLLLDAFVRAVAGAPVAATPVAKRAEGLLADQYPLRFLLAEDNAVNQKVALRILQQLGYLADVAQNGIEAVSAVAARPYDVIFMDVQMPEMDGLEATRRIREFERMPDMTRATKHIVIIAMTANAMVGDRERCLAVGMDDYLPKPVRPDALRAMIEKWGKLSLRAPQSAPPPPAPPAEAPKPEPPATSRRPAMPAHLPAMNPIPLQPPPVVDLPPPVDMERLTDLAGGEEGLAELVELYLTQTAGQIASIRAAIAAGQVAEVRRIAHSAAGANATCGMQGVVASLRALERMGESGDITEASAHIESVSQEFDRIKAYLEQHTKR